MGGVGSNEGPSPSAGGDSAGWRARLGSPTWVDLALPVIFLVLLAIAMVSSDTFLTQSNLTNLLRQIVINGLLSLGMLVVILSGGIDLSVGAVVALTAILVGEFAARSHAHAAGGRRWPSAPRAWWGSSTAPSSRASGSRPSS